MNKTLTISFVVALGVVGGGAYLLTSSDKNFSEYVPDPVTALMGDYLPDNFKAEQQSIAETIVEAPHNSILIEKPIQIEVGSIQVEREVHQAVPEGEVVVQEVAEENTLQNAQKDIEQGSLEQSDESAVEIAMQKIQKSLDEISTPTDVTSNHPKAKIIEKKIIVASSKISKLDIENQKLEEKFQNILRKNRKLAKKLQEIDKQLVQSN